MRKAYFDVNGTRLYCEVAGSGPAAVLIHGFTLDTTMWDDQFEALATHFQVIRYDLRGFGRSAVPTRETYSHVDDLKGLLEQLGVDRTVLIGLSKGGGVALDFALTHPAQVRALVLIDTILGGFSWSAEATARDGLVWERARDGGIWAAKESWLSHPLFEPAHRQPAVVTRMTQIVERYSGWHFVNDNPERNLEPPAARRLSELNMPLLVIVGEQDTPDFVRVANTIHETVPQAQKIVVPEAGHMTNMEAPESVTAAIEAFLGGL